MTNAELLERRRLDCPTSWWTQPELIADRRAFAARVYAEQPRMQLSRFGRVSIDLGDVGRPPLSGGARLGL